MTLTLNKKEGYVMLTVSIILSATMLLISVNQNYSGWNNSLNILEKENKEISENISENCTHTAIAYFLKNTNYSGNEIKNYNEGSCEIFPILKNHPEIGNVTIKTQSIFNKSYTNLEVIIDTNHIHTEETPLPETENSPSNENLKLNVISWKEIPRI